MRLDQANSRQIAANYLFWPGYPLMKNSSLIWQGPGKVEIVVSEEGFREIAGLEFYGGMLVPDYVQAYLHDFESDGRLIPCLEQIERKNQLPITGVALIEGADWKGMKWQKTTRIRILVR